MTDIPYYMMAGSGNNFIVVDNREHLVKDRNQFAAKVCQNPGADGVLFIEQSKEKQTDFFMRIVNADGSEAEACGNGYRCVGLYASKHLKVPNPKFISVGTLGGLVEINAAKPQAIQVKMIDPVDYKAEIKIPLKDQILTAGFINTGVPHTVLFVEDLKNISVQELGKSIRNHSLFSPKGTNVNFVQITGKNSLSIRTYERGVEGETLACGTGSAAAAIIANLVGQVEAPVEILPRSGEKLKVYFIRSGKKVINVYLEGPAEFVSQGRLSI